jgi:quinol monooxygenase YgiN
MTTRGLLLQGALGAAALVFCIAPAPAQVAADQAAFVVTYIEVMPTGKAETANLIKQVATASRKEPGNLRYEVLEQLGDPTHFAILEVWNDAQAFQQHMAAAALTQFRDKVKPLRIGHYDERPSFGMAIGPVQATGTSGAVFVLTHVDIAGQNNREEGTATLKKVAEDGRKEPGAERFEIWQQANRLNHFTVNEVWKDEAAYETHLTAPTTRAFREKIGPMLGALYDARVYKAVK